MEEENQQIETLKASETKQTQEPRKYTKKNKKYWEKKQKEEKQKISSNIVSKSTGDFNGINLLELPLGEFSKEISKLSKDNLEKFAFLQRGYQEGLLKNLG